MKVLSKRRIFITIIEIIILIVIGKYFQHHKREALYEVYKSSFDGNDLKLSDVSSYSFSDTLPPILNEMYNSKDKRYIEKLIEDVLGSDYLTKKCDTVCQDKRSWNKFLVVNSKSVYNSDDKRFMKTDEYKKMLLYWWFETKAKMRDYTNSINNIMLNNKQLYHDIKQSHNLSL